MCSATTMLESRTIGLLVVVVYAITATQGQEMMVKIKRQGEAQFSGSLNLMNGENEVVICEVTRASTSPVVTFGFRDASKFPTVPRAVRRESVVDNKFNVNMTLSFQAVGAMNNQYLVCNVNSKEYTARIDMFFPPLLTSIGHKSYPTEDKNKFDLYCDTFSVPESAMVWSIGGKLLNESTYQYTEKQDCQQVMNDNHGSSSMKYLCASNLTLTDLKKQDIGTLVNCDFLYQGKTYSPKSGLPIDFLYRPESVSLVITSAVPNSDNKSGKMRLKCTTKPANPAPTLYWYFDRTIFQNRVNMSQYDVKERLVEHNGKIVEQTVDVTVTEEMIGKDYFCCTEVYFTTTKSVCDSVTIKFPYLSEILAPQMDEFTVYVGSNFSIPCIVDSYPVATLIWYKQNGNRYDMLLNNTMDKTNILYLNFDNVSETDAGSYYCRASLSSVGKMRSKVAALKVIEPPVLPTIAMVHNQKPAPKFVINTADTAPDVPQSFYIQYKETSDAHWIEISKPFSDTLPGHEGQTYEFEMSTLDLPPGKYQARVKALAQNGLVSYTKAVAFQVNESDGGGDEMVTRKSFNTAIIVSVVVTAVVFIIILIAIVCFMKRR